MMGRIINILATVTLVEMMVTLGLGVKTAELMSVGRKWGLLLRAGLANYLLVPAGAVGLLLLFDPQAVVAAGFLVAVCCPGAPFAPPFTSLAKGNTVTAVGLMVVLAGTSAVLSPLLLGALVPLVAGDLGVEINAGKMIVVLLGTQLLPLCAGLLVRQRRPAAAERLQKPMARLSTLLNVATLGLILATQWRALGEIRVMGYLAMAGLVVVSCATGWLLGWPGRGDRTAMAMVTSVRNVGVALVIVTSSFGGSGAVTVTTAFALLQTLLVALIAVGWGSIWAKDVKDESR